MPGTVAWNWSSAGVTRDCEYPGHDSVRNAGHPGRRHGSGITWPVTASREFDLEFLLKQRVPQAWAAMEPLFQARRLRQARRSCKVRDRDQDRLFDRVQRACLFVGQPRSGHSVLGALLNAHRNILISHNLDVLHYLRAGFDREELFHLILERERWLGKRGRRIGGYVYDLPGQWLGYHDELRVIGDKRAGSTSQHLSADPDLLKRFADRLGMPVIVIHHLRNPWDNISSLWTRADIRRGRSMPELVRWYFEMLEGALAAAARPQESVRVVRTYHEDMVRDPSMVLSPVLDALGVSGSPEYLDACRRFVHPGIRRTRDTAPWTDRLIEQVDERRRMFPPMARYSWDD